MYRYRKRGDEDIIEFGDVIKRICPRCRFRVVDENVEKCPRCKFPLDVERNPLDIEDWTPKTSRRRLYSKRIYKKLRFLKKDACGNPLYEGNRLDVEKAIKMMSSKYDLSDNISDYEFLVLVAVHADCPNDNGDAFPLEELERYDERLGCKVYQSFIMKPHLIEHNQSGPAYGFVLDAHLRKPKEASFNPSATIDNLPYVELVVAVDCVKDRNYGDLVRKGAINTFSMGCSVEYTLCNVCQNKASLVDDLCEHIKFGKMNTYKIADTGEERLAFEWCYGVEFEEISAVGNPADRGAVKEEVLSVEGS